MRIVDFEFVDELIYVRAHVIENILVPDPDEMLEGVHSKNMIHEAEGMQVDLLHRISINKELGTLYMLGLQCGDKIHVGCIAKEFDNNRELVLEYVEEAERVVDSEGYLLDLRVHRIKVVE